MSIYTINQTELAKAIMPPNKRMGYHIAWLRALLSAEQRSNDILNFYIDGFTSASMYSSMSTYNTGDLVNGGITYDQKVYESQVDGNTGNNLLDTNFWVEVSPNFIGARERTSYYSSKIVFEYALNKWFHTTFRQPTAIGTGEYTPLSDIYIEINNLSSPLMYIAPDVYAASTFGPSGSSGFISPDDTPSFYNSYQYTIWIPNAVYVQLPGYNGSPNSADAAVRQFADKYNTYALTYIIDTY